MKKLLAIGVSMLAFAFLFLAGTQSAYAYTHTVTLKLGSRGAQVMSLQQTLNQNGFTLAATGAGSPGMETTYFGPITRAAVMRFQQAHALGVDGIVGPRTGAALGLLVAGPVGNPNQPGCPAGAVFNYITGAPCTSGTSTVPGCLPGYAFSPTTGQRCTGGGTSSGALQGGVGDVNLTTTSTDVEDTVAEADNNVKVLGFKADPEGSDVQLNSIRLTFKNCEVNCTSAATQSSENLDHYIDSVSIYMDDTKVGSVNVDDFNRDNGTPDEYTATINLSNAIVRENDTARFYVAVSANSSIDSDDIDYADWNVAIDTIRFTDATGAILTADVSDIDDQTFGFEAISANDDITMSSSTNNPDDQAVQVDESATSDQVLALAFKLDVDDQSQDVMINSIPVTLTVSNGGSDADNIENIIDTVTVKVGSDSWDADLDGSGSLTSGAGTATYSVDFDTDEFTIDSGDSQEVKVYLTFNDQGGNYSEGTIVTASVNPDNIDAETESDQIDVGGSTKSGGDLTLLVNGASFEVDNPTRITSGDNDENATFTFRVTASTFDNDIFIPKAGATAIDFDIINASTGTVYSGGTQTVSVSGLSDSDTVDATAVWMVNDDDTFTITAVLNNASATPGQYYARINAINFYTDESDTSLTTVNVDQGEFQTTPIVVGS